MSWVRFDDRFYNNRKIMSVSLPARWLYVSALCVANQHSSDGRIDEVAQECLLVAVGRSGNFDALAGELVRAGLWIDNGDTTFEIHDYREYQLSAEEQRKERAAGAARQQKFRERRRAEQQSITPLQTPLSTPSKTVPRPVPSRPLLSDPDPADPKEEIPLSPPLEPGHAVDASRQPVASVRPAVAQSQRQDGSRFRVGPRGTPGPNPVADAVDEKPGVGAAAVDVALEAPDPDGPVQAWKALQEAAGESLGRWQIQATPTTLPANNEANFAHGWAKLRTELMPPPTCADAAKLGAYIRAGGLDWIKGLPWQHLTSPRSGGLATAMGASQVWDGVTEPGPKITGGNCFDQLNELLTKEANVIEIKACDSADGRADGVLARIAAGSQRRSDAWAV